MSESSMTTMRRKPGSDRPSEEALVAQARERLAGFKLPRRVFFVDSLPRNAMGKVEKTRLPEQLN